MGLFSFFPFGNRKELLVETDASWWKESPKRPTGFRQALTFGGNEYVFKWIPAGEFDMGSPETEKGRDDDERLHHVILSRGFWLLETPVTTLFYNQVREGKRAKSNLPYENALYDNAIAFCKELTEKLPRGMKATLPTEAQWEYACRAGTTTVYYWGDDWVRGQAMKGLFTSKRLKRYPPNPWGLYDMCGAVREWVLDWYGEYPTGPTVDPVGPPEGTERVTRGGSYNDGKYEFRSASRASRAPDKLDFDTPDPDGISNRMFYIDFHGFRVALHCD